MNFNTYRAIYQLILFMYRWFRERFVNFVKFSSLSFKDKVRKNIFCNNKRTTPTPNSIAEKIKKKKVKDKIFRLS